MSRTYEPAGVEVPRIGLGTNRLTDDAAGVSFVRDAVAAGVRRIDTARLYTGGASERAIGEALAGNPEDLVVATKGGYGGAAQGRPEVLSAQIEQSLRALRTDSIALYYLDRGAIRHVGLSNVTVEQIQRARSVVPIAAVQNRFNVEDRDHGGVVDHCAAAGISFVAFYPLQGFGSTLDKLGWLLRRAENVLPIPGTRSIDHLRENLSALDLLPE